MRLNDWKMKPISWLRMRARSGSESPCTRFAVEQVGAARGRVEQAQDGEQRRFSAAGGSGDGDVFALVMSRLMPESAWVSTSSVRKTLVMLSSLMSGSAMGQLSLMRSLASHWDMSERITRSPGARPLTISIVLTELRPSWTWVRTA